MSPPTVVFDPAAAGADLFGRPLLLWLLLLVPATALVAHAVWRRRSRAEDAWGARGLRSRLMPTASAGRRTATAILLTLAVAGAALALARPRWGAVEHLVERRGVDVVFVLDSSLSMGARDVEPSRLFVAKALVRQMAREMPSNRVALIAAEGRGEVLTPLTLDGAVLDMLLDTVEPGSLPVPGTELAPALVASLELFPEGEIGHQVVVLISDGEDHGDSLEAAAERLGDRSVVVHAIGVGTPEGAPVPLPGPPPSSGRGGLGRPTSRPDGRDGFKRDREGKAVISQLGERVLARTAELTGGRYLAAASAAADTGPIVAAIAAMETKALEGSVVETREERFQWPLGAAALAVGLYLGVGSSRSRSRRSASPLRATPLLILATLTLFGTLASARPAAAQPPAPAGDRSPADRPAADAGDEGSLVPARWRYNPRQRTAAGIEDWNEQRFDDADARLGQALALSGPPEADDPDPLPLLNAGTGKLAAGDPATAGRLLAAAAEAAEARLVTGRADAGLATAAHYNLGNALFSGGDYAGAADAFRQALRRSPGHHDAKHNLELALARLEQQQQRQSGEGAGEGEQQPDEPRPEPSDPQPGDEPQEEGPEQDAPPESEPSASERPPDEPQPGGEEASEEGEPSAEQPPAESPPDASPQNERRLPDFEDQPDMDAEQAASILEAVENLERQRRREEAERQARRVGGGKDW